MLGGKLSPRCLYGYWAAVSPFSLRQECVYLFYLVMGFHFSQLKPNTSRSLLACFSRVDTVSAMAIVSPVSAFYPQRLVLEPTQINPLDFTVAWFWEPLLSQYLWDSPKWIPFWIKPLDLELRLSTLPDRSLYDLTAASACTFVPYALSTPPRPKAFFLIPLGPVKHSPTFGSLH
jgi:hypothetical protein